MSEERKGLYGKYLIVKKDPHEIVDDGFVMRFKDPYAWPALQLYAASIDQEDPLLHDQIMAKVRRAIKKAAKETAE